jgi:hypothetical protein
LKPEALKAKLDAQPFSTVREELMQKVLYVVLRHAQLRTPVRTGTLRRSETTRMEAQGARGYVGTNINYAPFVHAKQPFFEEGIEDSRGEIEGLLQKAGDAYLKGLAS